MNSTVDAFNVHGNYGVLNIDRPHVINTSYSYDFGSSYHGNPVLGGAINGWTISGTTTWQAGANLQAHTSQNLNLSLQDALGNGLTTRTYYGTNVGAILPTHTCNPTSGLSGHEQINLDCLSAPAIGDYGNQQLPYVSGPAYFNQDLAVHKNFNITERQKVEFRLSAFNLFNHPLWAFSGGNLLSLSLKESGSSWAPNGLPNNWGQVDTKSGSRVLQIGMKYSF